MSHYGYIEWCYGVWIGMHCQQGSPRAESWAQAEEKDVLGPQVNKAKVVTVWTITSIPLLLDHPNVSSWMYWMMLCSLDWNALPARVSAFWVLSSESVKKSFCIPIWTRPSQWLCGPKHPNHCCWTIPMSHYRYIEWCYGVWIGMDCQKGSPPTEYWALGG